ncbi:MAG TPA: PilT/PilU family type 4a pilus ATPase [Thermoanaerobaculia bacterium]
MKKLTPDPDLEALVRELNESRPPANEASDAMRWAPPSLPEGNPLERLLFEMSQRGASDLLVIVGSPPVLRIGGRLSRATEEPLDEDDVDGMLSSLLTPRIRQAIEAQGSADVSLRLQRDGETAGRAWRYRVNLHRQRGTFAAAIRALPAEIPTVTSLRLPPAIAELMKPRRGLILICGPTGSGKTTTAAALLGGVNRTESRHIITIEDPVEFEHADDRSVVEQIEVGRDTPSFSSALRASLRQNPDVIFVGEMRDLETAAIALTAAETGHLILSTLHTSDAAQAIHRIVDVFPPAQQAQIRQQLAISLNAIVVQHLIPRSDGEGAVVAAEVLLSNDAVRNHIRNEKLQNLASEITLGRRQGMVSLEDSLARLVHDGVISPADARVRATRPDELESLLRRG